ncbi:MAG: hypothetical protein ACRCXZ_00745 [Patescibacteria group bacterium]
MIRPRLYDDTMMMQLKTDLKAIEAIFDGVFDQVRFCEPSIMWSAKRESFVLNFHDQYIDLSTDIFDSNTNPEIFERLQGAPTLENNSDLYVESLEIKSIFGDISFVDGYWVMKNIVID